MTFNGLIEAKNKVKNEKALVHCITNPISINQCANALLSIGARPIMAEHPREVAEITATAGALMLNLGNITDVRMESMMISSAVAGEKGVPFVLDLVGVACSGLRRSFASELVAKNAPAVLKGNYSEINAFYNADYRASGVDAEPSLEVDGISRAAVSLARRHNSVVLASGVTDIVTDGERLVLVKNGTPQLASVTGTGCMLGALCAGFLTGADGLAAAALACAVLGVCGELAETQMGGGSFALGLHDELSTLTDGELAERIRMEVTEVEKD